ncbi:carbohydrate esterase [Abditibacteriota bacterium]|nr:carbohydrate esterase [Abditibacteriota bacterium]
MKSQFLFGRAKLVLGFVLLLLAKHSMAQTLSPTPDFSALDAQVQQWMDAKSYPGAGLWIVSKDGKTLHERYWNGYTRDTTVMMASATKWMEAALLMKEVDEGKMKLDAPIATYLPELKASPLGQNTLRQMYSHTSSINHVTIDELEGLIRFPALLAAAKAPDVKPGEVFQYGGMALATGFRAIEVVEDKPWMTVFAQKIMQPLGMKNTYTGADAWTMDRIVGGDTFPRCNAADYMNFLLMLLNDGVFNGQRVLSFAAIREMQADQVSAAKVNAPEYPEVTLGQKHHGIYGLGEWRLMQNEQGEATVISSPSFAGMLPWIDKKHGIAGVFIGRSTGAGGLDAFHESVKLIALTNAAFDATPTKPHPIAFPLPEPLTMQNGTPVTSAGQWRAARRPELLRLFEENIYGKTPIGRPQNLRFVVREIKKNARDGKATRLRVGVLFEGSEAGRQMELLVYLPNDVKGPVPMFLGLNFDGNFTTTTEKDLPVPDHFVNGLFYRLPDHRARESLRGNNARMWPYDEILARGYGIATACYGEVEPDDKNQWWHGPRALAPSPPTQSDDWGTIGGWAWALSRAMDYLQTNKQVDPRRIALFGFSRLGKTAMWAGSQDERFAAVISQNSGKGGVSLSKRLVGERVSHLAGPDLAHWFAPAYAQYADNEVALPVDGHELAALIAPRPLLILSGTEDDFSDPEGEFLSGKAATPVYKLLGSDGLNADQWPAPQTLINSTIGYYLRLGGHNVTPEDWTATLNWADQHLKHSPPNSAPPMR